jgi:hypothetical protein
MRQLTRRFSVVVAMGLVAGLFGARAARPQAAAPAPRAAVRPPRAPVTIPFDLATRHIVVTARINGSRPLSFVLDTGADMALVMSGVAKELGLSTYGTVGVAGAGAGKLTGSLVRDATWSLVGLEGFEQPVALALPLEALSAAMGQDIDGIIGGQFIRQFVLELDYQARAITLHDRDTFTYSGRGDTLPLEFSQGHPVVRATVTPLGGAPVERPFILDIGSGMALTLHSPFVAEQKLLPSSGPTVRLIGAAGAGGDVRGQVGRVESLQLGSARLPQVLTVFSQDTGGAFANPALAGNIGAQIASRFRLFFDYERSRLILEPSPTFADPFGQASSGLAIRAEGTRYGTFRVHDVLERSPAADAGLQVDDVITAIDGTPAADLTLSRIQELFEKPATYTVTLQRGETTLNVKLTPRKLV